LYLFGATQPLPDDIAALLTEGLQEGWILPVRGSALRPGLKAAGDASVHFMRPPPPRPGPATLDLAGYLRDRQARWSSPIVPRVDLAHAEYHWLTAYPELLDRLQAQQPRLEPSDLRLLRGFLQQLAEPPRALTHGQANALQGMVQGVLGEILHRATVLQHYVALRQRHPDAVLITERDLSSPRGRATSDAVIGTIDPDNRRIRLHAVYELTSKETSTHELTQMEISVEQRFVEHGITLTNEAREWAHLAVAAGDAAQRIEVATAPAHASLQATATMTAERALDAARLWLSVINPDRAISNWMNQRVAAILIAAIPRWQRPASGWDIEAVLAALQREQRNHQEYAQSWWLIMEIYRNFYGLGLRGRLTASEQERLIGLNTTGLGAWEDRFRRWFGPLGLIPAPLEDVRSATQKLLPQLMKWATTAREGQRTFARPEDLWTALEREVRPLAHDSRLLWPMLRAVFGNYYGCGGRERRHADTIAPDFQTSNTAVLDWEKRLRDLLLPLGCHPAPIADVRIAAEYTSAAMTRWLTAAVEKNRRFATAAALRATLQAEIQAHDDDGARCWPHLLAIFDNLYACGTPRRSQSALARDLSVSSTLIRNWERRFTDWFTPLGLTPADSPHLPDVIPEHTLDCSLAKLTPAHLTATIGDHGLLWSSFKHLRGFGRIHLRTEGAAEATISGRKSLFPTSSVVIEVARTRGERWRMVRIGGSFRKEALAILRQRPWLHVPSDEWLSRDVQNFSRLIALAEWSRITPRHLNRWAREWQSDDLYIAGRRPVTPPSVSVDSFGITATPPKKKSWLHFRRRRSGRWELVEISPHSDGALGPMLTAARQIQGIAPIPFNEWLLQKRRTAANEFTSLTRLGQLDMPTLQQWASDLGNRRLYLSMITTPGDAIGSFLVETTPPAADPSGGGAIVGLEVGETSATVRNVRGGFFAAPRILSALRRSPCIVVPSDEWLSRDRARGYSALKTPADFRRIMTPAQVDRWAGPGEWHSDVLILSGHTNFDAYAGIRVTTAMPGELSRGQFAIRFRRSSGQWVFECFGTQRTGHAEMLADIGFAPSR
ncbi:MAG: hypothetical protein HY543_00735, partial [Deltaproteobacteria bacterium]|nr:hypothetical protein [Deltaproteobacteria bacterium]